MYKNKSQSGRVGGAALGSDRSTNPSYQVGAERASGRRRSGTVEVDADCDRQVVHRVAVHFVHAEQARRVGGQVHGNSPRLRGFGCKVPLTRPDRAIIVSNEQYTQRRYFCQTSLWILKTPISPRCLWYTGATMPIAQRIIATLFYKATAQKKTVLATLCETDVATLDGSFEAVQAALADTGLTLVLTETEVALTTTPALSSVIETLRRDELKGDIGPAGAETLAIIAYRGPVSKAAIDRIRGVNSATIIRNLLVRGLIERQGNGTSGSFVITTATLAELGITTRQGLPNFSNVMNELDVFEPAQESKS